MSAPHSDSDTGDIVDEPYRFERLWIDETFGSAFWPIELCIAWALKRSKADTADAFLSQRFETGARLEGWIAAKNNVVRDLRSATLIAEAEDRTGERKALTALEWRNLELQRKGTTYFAISPNKSHQFRNIQLSADDVRQHYPASKPARQQQITSAAKETKAKTILIRTMRNAPDRPVSKNVLKALPDLAGLPKRAFDRIFTAASHEAGAPAWRAPGRRPK